MIDCLKELISEINEEKRNLNRRLPAHPPQPILLVPPLLLLPPRPLQLLLAPQPRLHTPEPKLAALDLPANEERPARVVPVMFPNKRIYVFFI